jgi:hypothetical protein
MAQPDLGRAHRSLCYAQSILGSCAESVTPADLASVIEFIETALRHLGHPVPGAPPKESLDSRRLTILTGRVRALEELVRWLIDHSPGWPESVAVAVADLDDVG